MADGRHAILLAPGTVVCADHANALRALGFDVLVIAAEELGQPGPTVPAVERALGAAVESLSPTVLVNGDGLWRLDGDPDEALKDMVFAMFFAAKAVLRGMMRQRTGRIINVTPPLELGRGRNYAIRGAVGGLTKSIAREVGSRGVTANVISPGYFVPGETPISQLVPAARFGSMSDVSGVLAFLAGDAAAYLTGQVLTLDGGLHTV